MVLCHYIFSKVFMQISSKKKNIYANTYRNEMQLNTHVSLKKKLKIFIYYDSSTVYCSFAFHFLIIHFYHNIHIVF